MLLQCFKKTGKFLLHKWICKAMMIKNFFFFTATILNWFKVLENDSYKDVIIESFRYLVDEKRVKIFAFVIKPLPYCLEDKQDNWAGWISERPTEIHFSDDTAEVKEGRSANAFDFVRRSKGQEVPTMGKESAIGTALITECGRAKDNLHSQQSGKGKMDARRRTT